MSEIRNYHPEAFRKQYLTAIADARATLRGYIGIEDYEDELSVPDFEDLLFTLFEARELNTPPVTDYRTTNPAAHFFTTHTYKGGPVNEGPASLRGTYNANLKPEYTRMKERLFTRLYKGAFPHKQNSSVREEELRKVNNLVEKLSKCVVLSVLHSPGKVDGGICVGSGKTNSLTRFNGMEVTAGQSELRTHILNGGLVSVQIMAEAPATARLTFHPTTDMEVCALKQTMELVGRKDRIASSEIYNSQYPEQFLFIDNGEEWRTILAKLEAAIPGSRFTLCETNINGESARSCFEAVGELLPSYHQIAEERDASNGTVITVFEKKENTTAFDWQKVYVAPFW